MHVDVEDNFWDLWLDVNLLQCLLDSSILTDSIYMFTMDAAFDNQRSDSLYIHELRPSYLLNLHIIDCCWYHA